MAVTNMAVARALAESYIDLHPEEVASMAIYLASDAARYIDAANLRIDIAHLS